MMTPEEQRPQPSVAARLWSRVKEMRFLLAATALVFAALALSGRLSLPVALVGFGVTGAAALHRARAADPAVAQLEDGDPVSPSSDGFVDTLISGFPDPVVVLDHNGIVQAFNRRAGIAVAALRLGDPVSFALRVPAVIEAIRDATASGLAQRAEFSERVPIDRWYEVHVIPIAPDASVSRMRWLLTLHDLTPLRRVEEMRADFIANASHELRTPLASLSGFIDTLQGSARQDPAARERFLAIMKEQASRMARLIDDLLSLSRIELSAHVQPETPVELQGIVKQVVDSLQMLAAERAVEVTVASHASHSIVYGDRDELVRVFENLIENALKYGASGRRVDITLEHAGPSGNAAPEAIVSVRDYGPGIPAEHLPRLTERFYRVDVGQSRAEGGTGLGLSLAKHVLNRHRGRLTIESVPGRGATFRAHMPLVPETPPS